MTCCVDVNPRTIISKFTPPQVQLDRTLHLKSSKIAHSNCEIRITTLYCITPMSTTPNLAEILAHLGDGVTVFDKEWQVAFANDKASEILAATDERFTSLTTGAFRDRIPGVSNTSIPR